MALFGTNDRGHQNACIGCDQSARLQHDGAAAIAQCFGDHLRIGVRVGRRVIAAAIRHAQATAQIEAGNLVPVGAQTCQQTGDFFKGDTKRCQIRDLTANMNIYGAGLNTVQRSGMGKTGFRIFPSNAEFVFGLAGGDFLMRAGIDIGIDASAICAVLPIELAMRPACRFQRGFRH